MNLPKIEAKFETTLAAKLTSDGTSFTLTGHTDKNGAELSGLYSFLIDGENSSAEYITGTVSNGTVTITGRGLDYRDGVTEREALQFEHTRGASVKITDFPLLGQIRNKLAGTETLESTLEYAAGVTPSSDQHLASKKYCDDTFVPDTGDTTIAGVKTFSSSPIVPTPTTDYQTSTKKYVDDVAVPNTGNTTIDGVKTFSSSPIVPTPTTDMQAATKKYMDDAIIAGGIPATTSTLGIVELNVAPTDPATPIAVGANDVAETGASKIPRLTSGGLLNVAVQPKATTSALGAVKLNVAPADANNPTALGSNEVAETGNSKVVRLKSNGKLNTTVLPILTKGNIPVANGTNYDTALAVGANDTVLMADSGETLGVKWADPLSNNKNYLTHSFYPPTFSMTYLYSGIEQSTRIIPDGSGNFCNFLIALSGAGYSTPYFMYVYRDANGRCYTTTKTWTYSSYTFDTSDLASTCGVILGNYLYYLGQKAADSSTQIVRLAKLTGNGNTEMTIGAGGNTINISNPVIMTDDTYLYVLTTTVDHWNKYSVSGTDLTYEADITMDTAWNGWSFRGATYFYDPVGGVPSWITTGNAAGDTDERKIVRITSGSATSLTSNNLYKPFNVSYRYAASNILTYPNFVILKRATGIYDYVDLDIIQFDGGGTLDDKWEGKFTFEPFILPTLS